MAGRCVEVKKVVEDNGCWAGSKEELEERDLSRSGSHQHHLKTLSKKTWLKQFSILDPSDPLCPVGEVFTKVHFKLIFPHLLHIFYNNFFVEGHSVSLTVSNMNRIQPPD